MAKSNMNQDILKILMSEEEIKNRIQEMGDELYDRFENKNPMFVGVLNGCFIFMADLVRAAQLKREVAFIGVSSYKNATKSPRVVQTTIPPAPLLGRPSRRENPIAPELAGFEVPDEFVVGYGLDYCQQYRNMPYIGVLKPEVYSK